MTPTKSNLIRSLAAAALLSTCASGALAVPSLSFIIDGNTFTDEYSFTNTSDAGERLLRFFIDLTGSAVPAEFDTTDDPRPPSTATNLGTPFAALNGTGATTGLTISISNDNSPFLDLRFNDFDVAETFEFEIDVDPIGAGSSTITGDELIGATAFADFSDGQRVSGVFAAITGNADASGFRATGVTLTPPIPLPAPALMLLGGLGLLGAAARRRKNG